MDAKSGWVTRPAPPASAAAMAAECQGDNKENRPGMFSFIFMADPHYYIELVVNPTFVHVLTPVSVILEEHL